MANQNLFEKYGIKEVADVTLYRIEKKEETYESQRQISAASVLKGALELRDVYPITENGVGDEEGFKAYVFTDATLNEGINYDCDDAIELAAKFFVYYDETKGDEESDDHTEQAIIDYVKENINTLVKAALGIDGTVAPAGYRVELKLATDSVTGVPVSSDKIKMILAQGELDEISSDDVSVEVKFKRTEEGSESMLTIATMEATVLMTIIDTADTATGVYSDADAKVADARKEVGTHEYSYAEQVAMLFAKRQNLIAKTGVRYIFPDADSMFGNIDFNDEFAGSPFSNERVVVVGIAGKFDENSYDLDEVNEVIGQLKDTITAKAYDVTYSDYAELVVNDEMGYFNPKFLGNDYSKASGVYFFDDTRTYRDVYGAKADNAIADAVMWSNNVHYSVNDAIDALRQKKLILDASAESGIKGIKNVFGGYKVTDTVPEAGKLDNSANYSDNTYGYSIDGAAATDKDGKTVTSEYDLANVNEALKKIGSTNAAFDKDLKFTTSGVSNRAIYVRVDGAVDTAAGAYIYLLKNKNAKKLLLDEDGIFKFTDKKGNKLYYQDKIFAGIETLALVVIGDQGLIFVVNRNGGKNTSRVAWMVNDNGYLNDAKAKTVVNNGLIHTTFITANNETFEATCTVGSLKVHKTVKYAKQYIPVLFLDSLKVSTISQTAQEVFATGGRGNANLIGWDYGKEITLEIQDALFTPASMSAIYGSYENGDFAGGVKETHVLDRMEPCTAPRNFIVPAGNENGVPSEADKSAQAVYVDRRTMKPYPDGTPIVEGETYLKWTRSVAYEGNSLGNTIEISADKFPGTYKVVGDTRIKNKDTGKEERFMFVIPEAKMGSEETITLEAEGDPAVFDFNMTVLRPDDGVMVRFIQYNVVENEEENDGSTMVKGTENLNLLDDAELFRVSADAKEDELAIGATEY